MQELVGFKVKGHVKIVDDLGKVLLDKDNAIHPQNMARVFARGLANEDNASIYRIAFGNGGTSTDAAYTVTYNEPNVGQTNPNQTFDTRLYNETYSEIVDETSSAVGTDPGSSDETGTRPGGGSAIGDAADAVRVDSTELGFTSSVVVTSVLNPDEPIGQSTSDDETDTESAFVFDEIALYTAGAPAKPSSASVDINLQGSFTADDDSGLSPSTPYQFEFAVDTTTLSSVSFTTPATGSGDNDEITFGDLCEALNTGDSDWNITGGAGFVSASQASVQITNTGTSYPSILGSSTNGFLRFVASSTGTSSTVSISAGTTNDMIIALNTTSGSATISASIDGKDQGVANDSSDSSLEQERMLTHLVFAPILKSANRTLTTTYTLSVAVTATT